MNSRPRLLKKPLCIGEAFRFAPGRQGSPAASFWKFWVSGSDIYATTRSMGSSAKISVHASGQIHLRLEGKDLNQLAPPLLLGNGQWLHAFELRFPLSPDAHRPPAEKLKSKRAFLIEVPTDTVLIMNLLVGQTGCSAATDLPHELASAETVWQAMLKDQRPVVLTVRVMEMDKQNRDEITFIRHELNPKANFSKPLAKVPYIETRRVVWDSKGGNVILVIPMEKESFCVPDAPSDHLATAKIADSRTIPISSPSASVPIAAPNGAIVGTLSIAGEANELVLKKNVEVRGSLGTVMLSINPSNLVFGESFRTPRILCPCVPTIDGAQPRTWEHSVFSYFDGTTIRAEIRQMSIGFRNANLAVSLPSLGASEKIIMAAPTGGLVLRASTSAPQSSANLEGSFLLRDI